MTIPRFRGDYIDRHGRMDAALESYAALSSLIAADLGRRHDAHKDQLEAMGDRLDVLMLILGDPEHGHHGGVP